MTVETLSLGRLSDGREVFFAPSTVSVGVDTRPTHDVVIPPDLSWREPYTHPWSRLAIAITTRCNLDCRYCYNQYHLDPRTLSLDQFKAAVEDLLKQDPRPPEVVLIVSGGEPLLARKVLFPGLEYAAQRLGGLGIGLALTLYSNAMLLDEEALAFLNRFACTVVVSLDGPRDVHDRFRVDHAGRGSHEQVLASLERCRAMNLDGVRFQARAVINDAATDVTEVMAALLRAGFDRFHIIPAYGKNKPLVSAGLPTWLRALRMYEQLLTQGMVLEVVPFYRILRKLLRPMLFADAFFPCTAGREMLGVGSDGNYYLCHHFSGSPETLGTVGQGLPPRSVVLPRVPEVACRQPCRDCWALHLCGGACYHREYVGGAPQRLSDCDGYREIIRQTVFTFIRLAERVPHVLDLLALGNVHVSPRHRGALNHYQRPFA